MNVKVIHLFRALHYQKRILTVVGQLRNAIDLRQVRFFAC